VNRSNLLAAASDGEGISAVFRNVEKAAEARDTTEIRALGVDPTTSGTAVEVNTPPIGPNHGEILALLFRCQGFDRFLTFLRGKPATSSAMLQTGPVLGVTTHDGGPFLGCFHPEL
jgi:hypothetical protein